ncbi:ferric reductase-like transmembrane domain-containing protein [Octadecabacter sp. 1_MG-2023]|uniref:ferric reductase-like transmembrane domain-containing protein n=1 Tax=unclassified Octadecabacter TaxID=196158 RepID=UPI001C09F41F|nr:MULTISPECIES: ferric reductase-like transmembrane domain-containing protein [unclassified Octadecabacter]MBU2991860.1 ferric reductase-like transmembrane domain-containing protein [Octadecabacter sp. B2R22]MDO6735834.1 ferric reductase-like transmembrane domain-containing protein [Octadecabacter sp. 1_MG-2023]
MTERNSARVWIWIALIAVSAWSLTVAASSPLLAYRNPVYIAAGIAGVVAMILLLVQPLLVGEALAGINGRPARGLHRVCGGALIAAVVLHIVALWVTSPPDVIDALSFNSPTPFSLWGVLAMWLLIATGVFALLRLWLRIPPRLWRRVHGAMGLLIVAFSVAHAVMIDGTMGTASKITLCAFALLAAVITLRKRRIF